MPLPVHLAPEGATSKAVKTTFNLKLIPGINPTNIRRTFEIFECESYLPKDLSAFKVFGEPFNEILVVTASSESLSDAQSTFQPAELSLNEE